MDTAKKTIVARWKGPNGSAGLWRSDGSVWLRHGLNQPWKRIGRRKDADNARKALSRKVRGTWHRIGWGCGTSRCAAEPTKIRKYGLSAPADLFPTGTVETPAGMILDSGFALAPPKGIALGRIAAYHLRNLAVWTKAQRGENPGRSSITLEPLTLDEIRRAVEHAASPLDAGERVEALAALADTDGGTPTSSPSGDTATPAIGGHSS